MICKYKLSIGTITNVFDFAQLFLHMSDNAMVYIDRTDQGGTRPSLFHLSAHSDKSRAHARDCHCAERWNNDGRVPPRFVLYLLYIKHDQMIFEPNIS